MQYSRREAAYLHEVYVAHSERVEGVEVLLEPAHFALCDEFIFSANVIVPRQKQGLCNKYHFIIT